MTRVFWAENAKRKFGATAKAIESVVGPSTLRFCKQWAELLPEPQPRIETNLLSLDRLIDARLN